MGRVVGRQPSSPRPAGSEGRLLLLLGLSGAAGALVREGVGRLLVSPPGHLAWSTFWVNVSGCVLAGLLVEQLPEFGHLRPVLLTGFVSSYTTFSTFSVQVDTLVRGGELSTAASYLLLSLSCCVAGTAAGLAAGHLLRRARRGERARR